MIPRERFLLSCFISPPLVVLPVAVCVSASRELWSVFIPRETLLSRNMEASILFVLAALCIAYPVMLVLGIPVGLALQKLKLFRPGMMAFAGGLVGAVPFLYWFPDFWGFLVLGVLTGAATGWLVWRISTGGFRFLPTPPRNDTERRTDMLTVLYDGRCALCRRAQSWLETQSKYVPLEYVAAGSQEARRRFPGLDHDNTLIDLTVVSFNGEVYHGAKAWIMCLWALKKYRGTALRLATPELMPTAKRVIAWVSRNRLRIGQVQA